jgi:hypothetical protein
MDETGALHDILHLHDVLARVSLAKVCHSISRARALDGTYILLVQQISISFVVVLSKLQE